MEKEKTIAPDLEKKKAPFSRLKVLCISSILLVLFVSLITPAVFGSNRAGDLAKATHNLKQLSLSLFEYEQIHGKYPKKIQALVSPEVINQETLDKHFGRSNKMTGLWWYNSGISELVTSAPPETPLLITPSIDDKCAVLRVDGSAKQMFYERALEIITDEDSTWRPVMGTEGKD